MPSPSRNCTSFIELTLLVALAPWARPGFVPDGRRAVLALTVAVGLLTDLLLGRVAPLPPGSLPQYLAFGLVVAGRCCSTCIFAPRRSRRRSSSRGCRRCRRASGTHFLIHSINAVLSLIRADPPACENGARDMADLFRVLMSDNRNLVPLADEVELCRQYLALERLRLASGCGWKWHLKQHARRRAGAAAGAAAAAGKRRLPWHRAPDRPGVISINIFSKDGQVHAILRNPYRADGGRHHAGNKMALANIRERLALHFDVEAALESRVKGDTYEVHIGCPTATRRAARPRRAKGNAGRIMIARRGHPPCPYGPRQRMTDARCGS